MINGEDCYRGVTFAGWGYLFLYFHFNIGSLELLPTFVAWMLFLAAIRYLEGTVPELALLRPLGWILVVWHAVGWVARLMGYPPENHLVILPLLASVLTIYFQFQMVTDFAALAGAVEDGEPVQDRLLRWRNIQTVLLTVLSLPVWNWLGKTDYGSLAMALTAIVMLGSCIGIMTATFSMRRLFSREEFR